jgi:hypothetical protein
MQPKCMSHIQIKAERFKEICLNKNDNTNSTILNEFLRDLFDPEVNLNIEFNNVSQIIAYLCGGMTFDDFKTKSKQCHNFFFKKIHQFKS